MPRKRPRKYTPRTKVVVSKKDARKAFLINAIALLCCLVIVFICLFSLFSEFAPEFAAKVFKPGLIK